ncbi:MAG: leucine-rich repeat domain-containing protein [Clostridia bacterium]|nr:leucine-rich repeat domain-containing protein [Clostridia bacterium]
MKKLIALCLAACLTVLGFASCGDHDTPSVTTTDAKTPTDPKSYHVENGLLLSCIGQANEDGVYYVPDDVTAIAESAFAGDTRLREIVIGPNVTMIGSGAFQNCTSLTRVEIAEGVKELGSYAFYNCTALTEVKLPSDVTVISPYAFYGCTALESISLAHVREIGDNAFGACLALERVEFSEELREIGTWAFAECTSLADTNLSEVTALKRIGDYAFFSCTMLREIVIPSGTESIGILAFYECTRLDRVEIADTVSTIDFAAFHYTPWYQENAEDYLIVGDGVLIKCTVHPNFIDLDGKNIKSIGGAAFWNAENEGESIAYGYKYAADLETLKLPDTLVTIGTSAFAGCNALKTVVLPAGVTSVGDSAFNVYIEGMESEADIDISACKNLTSIGDYAFHGCGGIETVTLPTSVKHVGEYAFAATGAYASFMERASKAEKEQDRFWITGDGILLAAFVPEGVTEVTVPDGVKMLAGSVFCGWDIPYIPEDTTGLSLSGLSKYNLSYHVTSVVLPDTLEVIGNSAFYRMLSLKSIELPESLRLIGMHAFSYCDALSSITGGGNVEEIQNYAFRYCKSMPGFRFSVNTKKIGINLFAGCSSLQHVYLPEGLSHPGTELFNSECTALQTVSLDPSARARIYTVLGGLQQQIEVFYYGE